MPSADVVNSLVDPGVSIDDESVNRTVDESFAGIVGDSVFVSAVEEPFIWAVDSIVAFADDDAVVCTVGLVVAVHVAQAEWNQHKAS